MADPASKLRNEVIYATAAWMILLHPEEWFEEWEAPLAWLTSPLFEYAMYLPYFRHKVIERDFTTKQYIEQFGFGKFIEYGISTLPPREQRDAWISMTGMIGVYIDLDQEPHIRAALSPKSEERIWEELPAAVRIALNDAMPGENVYPDRKEKKRSISSRTKRLLMRVGDEAAEKKNVMSRRLAPEEMDMILLAEQEARDELPTPEQEFLDYLMSLKPHDDRRRRRMVGTPGVLVARKLDDIRDRVGFTRREGQVFDLLRKTFDRRDIAARLGILPESVTRMKTRIKRKIEEYLNTYAL
jgi:DNA-binding NarL/FixJ family response regulator